MREFILRAFTDDEAETCIRCGLQEIVRCKDCVHRGKSEKCVLAAISEEKDFPIFMLDNRGDWYCGDGKRSETDGH